MRKIIASLLFVLGFAVRAQQPVMTPTLDLAAGGSIWATAIAPDGGIILGGLFSEINGVARINLARLKPDGTLDLAWNPGTPNSYDRVRSMVVDTDGSLYIGGDFGLFEKLDSMNSGAVDTSWDVHFSDAIAALTLDSSGHLYVAASTYAGHDTTFTADITKIATATGKVDPNWNTGFASGTFRVLAMATDDQFLYIGGYFESVGGQPHQNLARLSLAGTGLPDATWTPACNGQVYAIQADGNGNVYVGGNFTMNPYPYRQGLAKLSTAGTGAFDPDWNPGKEGIGGGNALILDGAGNLIIGGAFGPIPGLGTSNIAKVSTAGEGAVSAIWTTSAQSTVRALAISSTGTMVAGGDFIEFNEQGRVGYAAVAADGSLLPAANAGDGTSDLFEGSNASAFVEQPDGSIIVGGLFDVANGVARKNLLRLLPDGTIDPQWNPARNSQWDPGTVDVSALASDANGDIYIGGSFNALQGQSRFHLAKISGNGSGDVDPQWNPSEPYQNTYIATLLVNDGSSIFVGGSFYKIGGQVRPNLAKLSTTGAGDADPTWDPEPDNGVTSLALGPSQSLYVAGYFTHLQSTARSFIGRVETIDTGVADAWNPDADGIVQALQLDSSGAVYVAGSFDSVGGHNLPTIAKLAPDTGNADPDWIVPSQTIVGAANALAVADGYLYLGGQFTSLQGTPVSNLARLDTATGTLDPAFLPALLPDQNHLENQVLALYAGPTQTIYVGGQFDRVGTTITTGFAVFPPDKIFADGFEQTMPQTLARWASDFSMKLRSPFGVKDHEVMPSLRAERNLRNTDDAFGVR